MLIGLQRAMARGYGKVVLESDCRMALSMIESCLAGATVDTIVREIK